jgi:4-amino-4-deoxy-L-arabinose transferase-like glycosyltransferase
MDLGSLDRSQRAAIPLLVALTLIVLAPFAGKAFHVDDPLFLAAARQIVLNPLDPYGFPVNWYGDEMPMWEVTKNPPLGAYVIAASGKLFGFTEVPLHLVFLLPAVGVVVGTFLLAKRLGRNPFLAALLVLVAPVFLVSSTGVMCDVTMLALWLFALCLWIDGDERDDPWRLLASAGLVSAAVLTKYFAMSLIPLLAAFALLRRNRPWRRLAYLAIPVAVLVAYQVWTRGLYGRGLLLDAAEFATGQGRKGQGFRSAQGLVGLAFTGGCLLPAVLYAPRLFSLKALGAGLLAGALAGCALALGALDRGGVSLPPGWSLYGGIQFGFFVAGGLFVLALAVVEIRERRDLEAILLGVWLAGTFLFASFVNWSVNGRSILPMAPAAAILVAGRLGSGGRRSTPGAAALLLPAAVAAAISLAVVSADYRLAAAGRDAAKAVARSSVGRTGSLWFFGHWGFQHYMEAIGGKPVDAATSRLLPGDAVAVPSNNTNNRSVPEEWIASRESIDLGGPRWVATMQPALGAGFYASEFGPLPYSFGNPPPERCELIRIGVPASTQRPPE